jgi:glycosyltransferase involved in cell wall biosynthesis
MKLSVMVITYNHERFIAQAIESVLAQQVTFDYEIVIGEDCSTDSTRSVIMDFRRRYPGRIVPLLRDQNVGAMQNLEMTMAACRGQYVALLEGDDYWTCDQKLQKQVDFLDSHSASALCCHRVRFLDEDRPEVVHVFPPLAAGPYTIEDLLEGNFVMTCSTVLRRNLIGPLPHWFSRMKLGDWPLFALVARHGNIELMDEIMARYRVHPGGIWSSLSEITRLQEGTLMLKALDKHLGFRYTNTIRGTIARHYLQRALISQLNGKRTDTARHLVSCLGNGAWKVPANRRTLAGLAAYALIGSWYKIFSKANSRSGS